METFVRPSPDVTAVLETSGLLEVSEFRVFELAYANWYGVETDDETIERHFLPYMFGEKVPHFVRAFARKILRLDRNGRLDPRDFGIEPRPRTARGVVSGLFYTVFVGLTMTVLVILAKVTAERLGVTECMFPPCF